MGGGGRVDAVPLVAEFVRVGLVGWRGDLACLCGGHGFGFHPWRLRDGLGEAGQEDRRSQCAVAGDIHLASWTCFGAGDDASLFAAGGSSVGRMALTSREAQSSPQENEECQLNSVLLPLEFRVLLCCFCCLRDGSLLCFNMRLVASSLSLCLLLGIIS